MTFNYTEQPESTELNMGVFDEEVLVGRPDEANAWEDEYGRHVPRIGGVGKELCSPAYHIWMENAIPGVTDILPGVKYLRNRTDGKGFNGGLDDLKKAK